MPEFASSLPFSASSVRRVSSMRSTCVSDIESFETGIGGRDARRRRSGSARLLGSGSCRATRALCNILSPERREVRRRARGRILCGRRRRASRRSPHGACHRRVGRSTGSDRCGRFRGRRGSAQARRNLHLARLTGLFVERSHDFADVGAIGERVGGVLLCAGLGDRAGRGARRQQPASAAERRPSGQQGARGSGRRGSGDARERAAAAERERQPPEAAAPA